MYAGLLQLTRSEGAALLGLLARTGVIVAVVSFHAAAMLLVLTPETKAKFGVDKQTCGGCDCWDGLSKAPYDKGRYKFIYLNMEFETLVLVGLVFANILMFEKALRSLMTAVLAGRADWIALVAFAVSMPGVLYGVGATYHYINDQFYAMMPTQTFFTVTETLTAACIVRLVTLPAADASPASMAKDTSARLACLWLVWSIALCHVILAGLDQIFLDLFVRSATITAQAYTRALVFSISDLLLCCWSAWNLGLLGSCGPRARAWPGWRPLGVCSAGVLVVCTWYRLALPLV